MKNRISRLARQKRGATLTELIVCMTLVAIFLTAVAAVMARGYQLYHRIRSMDEAVQVAELLLDKIESELEGAIPAPSVSGPEGIIISGGSIRFYNANGSDLSIFTDSDGHLIIRYAAVNRDSGGGQTTLYGQMDWGFDPASYMGWTITDLRFDHTPGENLITVSVTLSSGGGTDFTGSRIIRCYNYADSGETRIHG